MNDGVVEQLIECFPFDFLQTHPQSESDNNRRDAGDEKNRWEHKATVKCEISRGFRESKGKIDTGKEGNVTWSMKFMENFQVADDPETLRIKQNTKNISNVAYHGDIQKKAAMERQREMTEIVDNRGKKTF